MPSGSNRLRFIPALYPAAVPLVTMGSNPGACIYRLSCLLLILAMLLLSACATYSERVNDVYLQLSQQQPAAALQALDKAKGPRRDRLAYLLNRAILLRMTQDYTASNAALEQAKRLIDEYSPISISEQVGALAVSETLTSYDGEPHEQVLVHLYAALNYLELGQLDEARVEALQVNLLLQTFADKHKNVYAEDPFADYLTAMIYEELGEWSDAMIAYRDAYKTYQRLAGPLGLSMPDYLKHDLLRLSQRMGLNDEYRQYQEQFGDDSGLTFTELEQQGELVFILHNGLAPTKEQRGSRAIDAASGRLVSIALPVYISNYMHATRAEARIDDRQLALADMTDIEAMARKTLEAEIPMLTARAVARAVLKDNAVRRVEEDKGPMAGLIANIAAAATEVADTRSWWTLPHDIMMLRTPLPAGHYQLNIELYANGILQDTLHFADVAIRAGHKTFIERHWIKPGYMPQMTRGRNNGY